MRKISNDFFSTTFLMRKKLKNEKMLKKAKLEMTIFSLTGGLSLKPWTLSAERKVRERYSIVKYY